MILQIILLVVLLIMSGFFSGSETAYFSLNHFEKEKLAKSAQKGRKKFILKILNSPGEILITIVTGNMIVNLFFASIMDTVVGTYISDNAWLFSILIGTVLVLIFGEMTPKNLAIRHSLPLFRLFSPILRIIHTVITPARYVLRKIEYAITSFVSKKLRPEEGDSRSLISSTFQIGLQKGIIHRSELSILESFLDFREKTASDVMTPRTDLNGIEIKTSMRTLMAEIRKKRSDALIPVFKDDIDHIIGYINIRDALPYRYNLSNIKTVSSIVKPIHPVPATKNLMELLVEIMQMNCEMALVIDEYGGTAGAVTFQHLVEDFLFFFYPTKEDYRKLDDNAYLVPGHLELEKVAQLLDVVFETESRTISGFITEQLEEIPGAGTELRTPGLLMIVRNVSQNRILEVEVRKES